jgi:hypothetical protein
VSWRPDPRRSSQTALQLALVRFGDFADRERAELSEEQFTALVSILTAWVAREHAKELESDELRTRRRAA